MIKKNKEWRILHGGLYRCCIQELENYIKEHSIAEGDILVCSGCLTEISAHKGTLSYHSEFK